MLSPEDLPSQFQTKFSQTPTAGRLEIETLPSEDYPLLVETLKKYPFIKTLIIKDAKNAPINSLTAILQNTNLTRLDLLKCEMGSNDIIHMASALAKNAKLRSLKLRHNHMDISGLEALAAALTKNKTLKILSLSQMNVGNEGAAKLAKALDINTTLTHLSLKDCEISNHGANALKSILSENLALRTLDLKNNPITDFLILSEIKFNLNKNKEIYTEKDPNIYLELVTKKTSDGTKMATAAAALLKKNLPEMTTLTLNGYSLNDKDIALITMALQKNFTVLRLDLRNNLIDIKGAKYFADALKKNKTLRELDLSNTNFKDNGVKMLAKALKNNTTLTSLNLQNCLLNESGNDLAAALKKNYTLTTLTLDGNLIDYSTLGKIQSLLTENQKIAAEKDPHLHLNLIRKKSGIAQEPASLKSLLLHRFSQNVAENPKKASQLPSDLQEQIKTGLSEKKPKSK